ANTRAWLGPPDANFSGPPTKGQDLIGHIPFSNTGREPARNGRTAIDALITADDADLAKKVSDFVIGCRNTPENPTGEITYPTAGFGGGATTGFFIPKEKIDP